MQQESFRFRINHQDTPAASKALPCHIARARGQAPHYLVPNRGLLAHTSVPNLNSFSKDDEQGCQREFYGPSSESDRKTLDEFSSCQQLREDRCQASVSPCKSIVAPKMLIIGKSCLVRD
jgi:hypothetical protein